MAALDSILLDLRVGARGLIRSRGLYVAALLSLALGIGGVSAVFSVVDAALLRPPPYPQPGRILQVFAAAPERGLEEAELSYARFTAIAEQARSFAAVGAFATDTAILTGADEPLELRAARVSTGLLDLLGVRPALGRGFRTGEDQRGAAAVVLLSDGLWRRRFGARRDIVGDAIRLDGSSATVIGVMPPGFDFPRDVAGGVPGAIDVWMPSIYEHSALTAGAVERGATYLDLVARLRPGVNERQAQEELDTLARRDRRAEYLDAGLGYRAVRLGEPVRRGVRPTLLILLGAIALVLLIACANVANLLLARAVGREKEMAVRAALGADRGRLLRQLLTESVLLGGLAACLGLALAALGLRLLVPAAAGNLAGATTVGLDGCVVSFTAALALATTFIFGLAPALRAAPLDLAGALGAAGRGGSPGPRHNRLRSLLVVGEIALAVTLLTGAGLLMRSFVRLRSVDLGFVPEGLWVATVDLPPARYAQPEAIRGFYGRLLEDLAAIPGVAAAGATQSVPLAGSDAQTLVAIDGRPLPPLEERAVVSLGTVSPGFFRAMGIPLLAGRDFSPRDGAGAPIVIIVNQSFARRFFPGESPLGQRVLLGKTPTPREIVGVVGDIRHVGLDTPPAATFYICSNQRTVTSMAVLVRTSTARAARALAAEIRGRVVAIDGQQPVGSVRTMAAIVEGSIAGRRLTLLLFGLFAGVALVLATIGTYGVMAYAVSERQGEIGLRMALGAGGRDVLGLVLGRGLRLALGGLALGLAGAWIVARLMAGLLFELGAGDTVTLAAIVPAVLLVAVLASYVPARRAMRLDPNAVLRHE